ncbi:unnamed protein product, partial [Allacma fusca]
VFEINCATIAGAPITISRPHLIGASESILDDVVVKKLKDAAFATELDIEPNSGLLIRLVRRTQLNLEYQTLPNIVGFENIPQTFIPIFWIEEIYYKPLNGEKICV